MKHRHLRLDLKKKVRIFWNGSEKQADIENISIGGVLLRADYPVIPGDFLAMHLEDETWPVTIKIYGEVIRKGRTRLGVPAFAMKFGRAPEMLRRLMHELIVTRRAMAG